MLILYLGTTGCSQQNLRLETLPPLKIALDCLPDKGAMIAAHRGTSRDWQTPENSISGLKKLIGNNYLMAEIDVARLRDGTLITFHDGVWDDLSTATGVVASSTQSDLDKILLRTRRGILSADRPPKFEDILIAAKNKIYLEIDFKTSANIQQVIDLIYKNEMEHHVLLISYTQKQANILRNIAPDMALSVSRSSKVKGDFIWLGDDIKNTRHLSSIQSHNQYVIGRVGQVSTQKALKTAKLNADILVTDYPNQYLPLTGLNKDQRKVFRSCLGAKGY